MLQQRPLDALGLYAAKRAFLNGKGDTSMRGRRLQSGSDLGWSITRSRATGGSYDSEKRGYREKRGATSDRKKVACPFAFGEGNAEENAQT